MKIKSVSGVACDVRDIEKAAEFYEALGFEIRKRERDHATAYSNWFWVDLRSAEGEAATGDRGGGVLLYLSVDDVDAFHADLLEKGLKPASEPHNSPWGNREFAVHDPDGHELVIFKRR